MSLSNDIIEYLILQGAVEIAGVSESGEFLYNFTPKLAEISPEIYREITNQFYSGVMDLWEKGFLEIDLDSDDPVVLLIEAAVTPEAMDTLSPHQRNLLENIIRQFNRN